MASNINYLDIDEEFPVPGQDNDSQGFRDNFAVTKSSLQSAKTEIGDLQLNSAKLNAGNNFQRNSINNATLINNVEFVYPTGDLTTDDGARIRFTDGHYQNIAIATDDLNLTLEDFGPNGFLSKMRLAIRGSNPVASTEFTFNWIADNGGTIKTNPNNWPWNEVSGTNDNPLKTTVDAGPDPEIFDIWTDNSGGTVYIEYIGKFTT